MIIMKVNKILFIIIFLLGTFLWILFNFNYYALANGDGFFEGGDYGDYWGGDYGDFWDIDYGDYWGRDYGDFWDIDYGDFWGRDYGDFWEDNFLFPGLGGFGLGNIPFGNVYGTGLGVSGIPFGNFYGSGFGISGTPFGSVYGSGLGASGVPLGNLYGTGLGVGTYLSPSYGSGVRPYYLGGSFFGPYSGYGTSFGWSGFPYQ
jgi:hypothetical protein